MNWSEMIPEALKDSVLLIGIASMALGLLVRSRGPVSRGLGMSLIVVGAMLVILPPLWRLFG